MFSSNQTPVEDMKKAYELGAYINLDDATMVDFLERVAGVPENIFCRYNPGGTLQSGRERRGLPGHGQARRRQVWHDRGADDRQL